MDELWNLLQQKYIYTWSYRLHFRIANINMAIKMAVSASPVAIKPANRGENPMELAADSVTDRIVVLIKYCV